MENFNKRKKRSSSRPKFRVWILFFLIILVLIACFIIYMKDGTLEPGTDIDSSSSSSEYVSDSSSSSDVSVPDSSQGEITTTSPPISGTATNPVPLCESVGMDYFKDAVIVGDSISVGISGYGFLPYENVFASIGLNISKIDTEIMQTAYGEKTVIEAIKIKQPKIVYIMLGSNGISWMTNSAMLDKYGAFVDEIKAALPDTVVYVISIPPVTSAKETATDYPVTNADIDAYNSDLLTFANDKGLHFVDLNTALKNNAGKLDAEIAQKDGMHFKLDAYNTMFDYLMTHVAQ